MALHYSGTGAQGSKPIRARIFRVAVGTTRIRRWHKSFGNCNASAKGVRAFICEVSKSRKRNGCMAEFFTTLCRVRCCNCPGIAQTRRQTFATSVTARSDGRVARIIQRKSVANAAAIFPSRANIRRPLRRCEVPLCASDTIWSEMASACSGNVMQMVFGHSVVLKRPRNFFNGAQVFSVTSQKNSRSSVPAGNLHRVVKAAQPHGAI